MSASSSTTLGHLQTIVLSSFSPPSWHMGVRARITNSCFHDKKLCIHTPAMRLLSFFAHNRFRLLVPFFSLFLLSFFLHPGVRYPGTHEQHVQGGEGVGGELLLAVILPSTVRPFSCGWCWLWCWVPPVGGRDGRDWDYVLGRVCWREAAHARTHTMKPGRGRGKGKEGGNGRKHVQKQLLVL